MQAASLPATSGWQWIRTGLQLFLKQPLAMFAWSTVVGLFVLFAVLTLPIGPLLLPVLMPIVAMMSIAAAKHIEAGRTMLPSMWPKPLQLPGVFKKLTLMGVMYAVAVLIAEIVAVLPFTRDVVAGMELATASKDLAPMMAAMQQPLILFVIVVLAKLGLDWFFATERGLAIRATGSNARMARSQGVNTGAMILLGMAISNGLVGLAGALFVQTQGGSDISMGIGTIVIGLAAVIVGESILPSRRIVWATLAVVVGAIVYRFFIAAALNSDFIGLKAQDLNLVTALLVTVALVIPQLKRKFAQRKS